jgi:hypothetical protein
VRRVQPAAIALLIAVATLSPAQAVERILRFVSDVEVGRNGDLAVTGTIRVQAEGNQIRVVAEPTASQQTGWWLQDNLPGVVAGIGLAVVLGFYVFAWAWLGAIRRAAPSFQ